MTIREWRVFLAAPHRVMFGAGAVQVAWLMGLWAADVGARHGGLWPVPVWHLPAPWLHALGLIYGLFAFYVFGFILTAGPRWLNQPDTAPAVFQPAFALLGTGWLLADLGLLLPALLPLGLGLALAGWLVALRFLWQLVARAESGNRRHIALVAGAHSFGAVGLASFLALAAGGPAWLGPVAIALGLWGYLLPVFATVIHRMLPFFSSSVIRDFPKERPWWPLAVILVGGLGHGALSLVDRAAWTWLADIPAAVAALRLTLLWRLRDSFAARVLAVLHVGFAWLGIAFGLFGLHSLILLLGGAGLGLAPMHALTIGFFSSMLLGMATRVTQGHSGLPITGGTLMWVCFWAVQAAALLRMGGEFIPLPGVFNLTFLAALLWLGAFGTWAIHYMPAYWRPRADGQPG